MPPKSTIARARILRRAQTKPERRLWQALLNRQIEGAKFRRQHPIGPYFADLACVSANLIIEIDGATHNERQAYDARRTAWLETAGWRVLRFSNQAIMDQLTATVEVIQTTLSLARLREREGPAPPGVGG